MIGAEGIDLEEVPDVPAQLRKTKGPDPALRNKQTKTLDTINIRNIAFTGVDPKFKKIFTFIASDPETQVTNCHVFETKVRAKVYRDAVADAFQQAVKIRADPFALSRHASPLPVAFY